MNPTFSLIDPGFLAPPAGGFTSQIDVNQARIASNTIVPTSLFQEWFDTVHLVSPRQKENQAATLASSGSLNQRTAAAASGNANMLKIVLAAAAAVAAWRLLR